MAGYIARTQPSGSPTHQLWIYVVDSDYRTLEDAQVAITIDRIGDTPGVNSVVLDYGVATIELKLIVHARAAYAAGAIEAARWLVSRPNGLYHPIDALSD